MALVRGSQCLCGCVVVLQAARLVERIKSAGRLVIKDRTYHFKTYKSCFVGMLLGGTEGGVACASS